MTMTRRVVATAVALLVLASCTGEMNVLDPDEEVAHLALISDDLGALLAKTCIFQLGAEKCARYPNPLLCDYLELSIRGDGSVRGQCKAAGAKKELTTTAEGIPISCRVDIEVGCVQCVDLYGGAVVDNCGEKLQLFTGEGFTSDGAATLPEAPPPGGAAHSCEPINAQIGFVTIFNEHLTAEGFQFSYQPDYGNLPQSGFFSPGFYSKAGQICDMGVHAPGVPDRTECDEDAEAQGRCYCEEHQVFGVRCRCARITTRTLLEACASIPGDCDREGWSVAIWQIYGATTKWINTPSDAGGAPSPKSVAEVASPKGITCLGSPLVLDLRGDGIALTSVEDGVSFDLTGTGPMRTAWTRGDDDAFLALDRDGNGVIDHGGELFGEASFARDGFATLAELDRAANGGNGDGLIDGGDRMFRELRLWTDANRDGVSQAGELRPLPASGVSALGGSGSRGADLLDRHGNDLSLRGEFFRSDGSRGPLVDVYFMTRAPGIPPPVR
jgi:hypothetical protein